MLAKDNYFKGASENRSETIDIQLSQGYTLYEADSETKIVNCKI